VRVWSPDGPRAADVRGSMWLESQLLLQSVAADGRADGDPYEHDIPVSEKIVHGVGCPTEALLSALLSFHVCFPRGIYAMLVCWWGGVLRLGHPLHAISSLIIVPKRYNVSGVRLESLFARALVWIQRTTN
jgi:hypothetical protein